MSFFQKNLKVTSDLEMIANRQQQLKTKWKKGEFSHLFNVDQELGRANQKNCENMIGAVALPVGLAGPVKITCEKQTTEFFVPLATSEGALVASVNRGLKAINQAGEAEVIVQNVGITRAPVFAFKKGSEAYAFTKYLEQPKILKQISSITEATSAHLKFLKLMSFVRGRNVYVRFSFLTDQAMGMNMVTIALQKLWEDFLSQYEGIEMLALSSNVCTDKKSSFINQILGRGYSAQAEVFLSEKILQSIFKTNVKALIRTHHAKNLLGSNLAGSLASNMQFANVVAAFYMATGQDLAHVTEASQGTTIIEEESNADGEKGVYFAVNLPNLPLGSVGGGTNLPAQKELKNLISKDNKKIDSSQLVAILATGVLAVEISGLAALSNHTLAKAHQSLAR